MGLLVTTAKSPEVESPEGTRPAKFDDCRFTHKFYVKLLLMGLIE
jgi:hypothetical protein